MPSRRQARAITPQLIPTRRCNSRSTTDLIEPENSCDRMRIGSPPWATCATPALSANRLFPQPDGPTSETLTDPGGPSTPGP